MNNVHIKKNINVNIFQIKINLMNKIQIQILFEVGIYMYITNNIYYVKLLIDNIIDQ